MNKWIRRKRNSWGYGVQSPNDFYFVQHVLREKSPYYAYATLEDMATTYGGHLPHGTSKASSLLFRLANHVHPDTIIEVGAGFSIYAMALACPSAQSIAITTPEACNEAMLQLSAQYPHVEIKSGDEIDIFKQLLCRQHPLDLLHIAHTPYYREVMDAALPYVTDRTLVIIEGIRDSKDKRAWWKSLQGSPRTGISYDLGNIGLLFFDRTRHKDTYWINLRKRS